MATDTLASTVHCCFVSLPLGITGVHQRKAGVKFLRRLTVLRYCFSHHTPAGLFAFQRAAVGPLNNMREYELLQQRAIAKSDCEATSLKNITGVRSYF